MKQDDSGVALVVRESIALLAVLSQIDDMVNYAIFEKYVINRNLVSMLQSSAT